MIALSSLHLGPSTTRISTVSVRHNFSINFDSSLNCSGIQTMNFACIFVASTLKMGDEMSINRYEANKVQPRQIILPLDDKWEIIHDTMEEFLFFKSQQRYTTRIWCWFIRETRTSMFWTCISYSTLAIITENIVWHWIIQRNPLKRSLSISYLLNTTTS